MNFVGLRSSRSRAKEYSKTHYNKNKSSYRKRNKSRRQELTEFVDSLKKGPCKDCGKTFPPCAMDFDHLGNKFLSVSKMRSEGYGKERILAEMAKCELVCAVCHRIRTHNRRNKT